MPSPTTTRFAIIGAGAGGLCAGIRLRESGRDDFLIFDREPRVGGTWQRNTYPGAACDIASHLYCYSFAPNPDWTRPYAPQREILAYFERVAREYGLEPHLRLGTGVSSARWDEGSARWRLELASGETVEAQFVIGAVGMFGEPARPDIPGLDAFRGAMFHSAEWDHAHDLAGERVAVIGSAASAVQLVPEVAKVASELFVFQRTPNWVLPKDDVPYTREQMDAFRSRPELMAERRQQLFDVVEVSLAYDRPDFGKLPEEFGRKALEVVRDPRTRARLTPDHPFGCKRPLLSNDYLQAFNRDDVELVVDPIERVTADAVVTTDGKERTVDAIVLATGFATTRYLSAIEVRGRDGVRLDEAWSDAPEAYLGLTTSGFPNLFLLYGPNTNGGNSIILMLEYQVEYMMRLLDEAEETGVDWLDVRRDVMDAFNATLQEQLAGIPVLQASCNGYYRSPSGRIVTQWPFNFAAYRERVDRDGLASFETGRVA
ncbi:MAG: NAD(P)/FAD-dependent oxidoreductase [Myxococcota bacterium]|nr:NAD(P)/FAD-dependent oxidoreductase [Myxococcales bacterium]